MTIQGRTLIVAVGGVAAAVLFGSPQALADPSVPAPPAPPAVEPVSSDVAPVSAAAAPTTADTSAAPAASPADGVPHLLSPQNLPPGTTDDPATAGQSRSVNYLRDLWHAVQTQEVSGKDALLLLTQRPLDPNATPAGGKLANPTPPQPAAPLAASAAPAPEAGPATPAPPDIAPASPTPVAPLLP